MEKFKLWQSKNWAQLVIVCRKCARYCQKGMIKRECFYDVLATRLQPFLAVKKIFF